MRALHLNAILDLRETNRSCKHSVKQHKGQTWEEEQVNSLARLPEVAAEGEGMEPFVGVMLCPAPLPPLVNGNSAFAKEHPVSASWHHADSCQASPMQGTSRCAEWRLAWPAYYNLRLSERVAQQSRCHWQHMAGCLPVSQVQLAAALVNLMPNPSCAVTAAAEARTSSKFGSGQSAGLLSAQQQGHCTQQRQGLQPCGWQLAQPH